MRQGTDQETDRTVTGGRKSEAAFRTIGEVSAELNVPAHVLRFWETKFAFIRPVRPGRGRRYYRPDDVELLVGLRELLYSDGYTIRGVQKLANRAGAKERIIRRGRGQRVEKPDLSLVPQEHEESQTPRNAEDVPNRLSARHREALEKILADLETLRDRISK